MNTQKYLGKLEANFRAKNKIPVKKLVLKIDEIESLGGVYGVWKKDKLLYFGETTHLNHRIEEMVKLGRHHCVTLILGKKLASLSGRKRAECFCNSGYRISWMIVNIGRAELEEYMVARRDRTLLNKVQNRFTRRSDYEKWI